MKHTSCLQLDSPVLFLLFTEASIETLQKTFCRPPANIVVSDVVGGHCLNETVDKYWCCFCFWLLCFCSFCWHFAPIVFVLAKCHCFRRRQDLAVDKMFCSTREASNWSLSAPRIPSRVTFLQAAAISYFPSFNKAGWWKGGRQPPLEVLTKLPIELLSLRVKYRKFYQEAGERADKPLWEYILFIQRIGALWSLGEFFSRNPNSILSHMSSRRTGIEDLKSDLIFFAAPDIVNPNLQKFAWNLEISIFANCEKC